MAKRATLERTAWNKVAFRRLLLEPGHRDLCHLDLDLNTDRAEDSDTDSQRTLILGEPFEPGRLAPAPGKPARWDDLPTAAGRERAGEEASAQAAAADEKHPPTVAQVRNVIARVPGEAMECGPSLISTLASVGWLGHASCNNDADVLE